VNLLLPPRAVGARDGTLDGPMNARTCTLLLVHALPLAAAGASVPDYLRDIKPLFAERCYQCHAATQQKNHLRLDTAAAAVKGGDHGPAIVPGKSAASLLVKAISGTHKDVTPMPYRKPPLSTAQVALIKRWIDAGAVAPADEKPAGQTHWAFVKPARPDVQSSRFKVQSSKFPVRNPIDTFILSRLEKEKLTPSPEADRVTLIRRLSLDLLGLPPTPAEVDAFVNDASPDAHAQLVERLLKSPHYGERWGRWWLDAARYADSNGYSIDAPRQIWAYRDWVVNAMNRDMPFDQFTIEQLAGDMLPAATLEQKVATGFHRNTQINQEGGIDLEQFRIESVIDRVNTTATAWLGLTLACAQCHDHKFDPFTQRDYYGMFAFLNNADEPTLPLATAAETKAAADSDAKVTAYINGLPDKEPGIFVKSLTWERSLTPEERQKLSQEVRTTFDTQFENRTLAQKQLVLAAFVEMAEENRTHQTALRRLRATRPTVNNTMVMREREKARRSYLFIKGDFTRDGGEVTPTVPVALHPLPGSAGAPPAGRRALAPNTGGGSPAQPELTAEAPSTAPGAGALLNRLDFARWLTSPENPLTARVIVNRMWQQYFGRGIVETENDFGTQGTPPSHPELLDWLATEFMSSGWSLKHMHRLIVNSATYRQSSRVRPELNLVDANNKLLARQNRLRLDAEIVRDVALSACGLLSPRMGGPSVHPPIPDGVMSLGQVKRAWDTAKDADRYRRGLYTFYFRATPYPAMNVFDAPDAYSTCTRRIRSNTPLQALTLLNDAAFYEFAQALAARVLKEVPAGNDARLEHAFRLCLARKPSAAEQQRLGSLVAKQLASASGANKEVAAWTTMARVLLNLDETITRE